MKIVSPCRASVAFLVTLAVFSCPQPAKAGWFGSSAASLDVRGISLGMSEDAVAKLHPELQLQTLDTDGYAGGHDVQLDPSLIEHRLKDDGSCGEECFSADFASAKQGGGVYNLFLKQTLPAGTSLSDLLADMEKKYGSPTDLQQGGNVPSNSSSITASWGMSINDSALESNPQSGQVLKVEMDDNDGEPEVSIFLIDFTVETADAQLKKDFLAQAVQQQTGQSNKALNY